VIAEEQKYGPGRLQLGLVDVEIDPVEGFQLQSHVVVDDLGDGSW
jgi:hypothetical protein